MFTNTLHWLRSNLKSTYINIIQVTEYVLRGSTGGSVIKNPPANGGDTGWISRSGKIPWHKKMATRFSIIAWEPMNRGAWQATI